MRAPSRIRASRGISPAAAISAAVTVALTVGMTVVIALSGGGPVAAQIDEPAPTPPPNQRPDITTAVIESELSEPSINQTVGEVARFAHEEIGGKVGGKRDGLVSVALSGTSEVVLAARDLAEKRYELVVMSGGDSQGTIGFAGGYPGTMFLDIDQPMPCVTEDGRADPSGTCAGGITAIPPNYSAVDFDVDEGAYLAGVIAAIASRNDRLGVVSGTIDCPDCNRYLQGFLRGAESVKPEIEVTVGYLSDDDEQAAFGDATAAKTYANAFIDVYDPDVVLPLVGRGSRGVIEAACAAGILAIGTDIDVSATYPDLADCVLASVTKDLEYAVRESIFAFANGTLTPEWRLGLSDGHVAVTDEWTRLPGLPVDLSERYSEAEEAILTGQVETCPTNCGAPYGPGAPEVPDAPEDPDANTDPDAPAEPDTSDADAEAEASPVPQ